LEDAAVSADVYEAETGKPFLMEVVRVFESENLARFGKGLRDLLTGLEESDACQTQELREIEEAVKRTGSVLEGLKLAVTIG
jgi:hypothetical protein